MKKILAAFLIFVLYSCSESTSSPSADSLDISPDESHAGMMRVKAAGKSTVLGSNLSAKTDEFPAMQVAFSYDFSIGEHEVRCDEYNALALHPRDCAEDFPVTNVTYFDAALLANEKSKAEGLDTAYEYASAAFSEAGNCTELGGLVFYPERNAYRLPTEAEWVLVASRDFRPSASWNSGNSDYRLHPVCSAEGHSEICDMAGNAMEWVNNWKGNFRDTVLSNFVGASDGGSLGERVLKGGSFRNAPEAMTLYSRGDVYAVTSSTFADYVGFRLALGKIPDAVYLDKNGQASDSPVQVKASSNDLKEKLGTFRAKLAFRKDESGNLAFVNYWNASLTVTEILDTLDAYHPAISPDGKRVAFCTRPEGISGKSDLYVRDLDAKGSNLVKLDVESAAIPRWRVVGADTQVVYVTSAGNNSDAAEWKLGSTWAVPFSGGNFGTPEKLLDGTYNGGVSADGNLAVSGARLLRASADGKESVWYSGEQACNASLSDSSKETLFLDFGGETGKSFAGKSYDAHEMLLIADSSGKLSKMVPSSAGYAFDHTEWVRGREELAIATLTDAGGAHSKIALVDISDSSVLELAQGTELWHPDLWVANSSSQDVELDPDSAGVYLDNPTYALLSYKMKLFWKFKDSMEVAILGSSRAALGVDAKVLKSWSLNMATIPCDMNIPYFLTSNYLLEHSSRLKTIVVEISPDLWMEYDSSYTSNLYLKAKGFIYDFHHDYWKNGLPDGFLELCENAPVPSDEEYASRIVERGFSPIHESLGWLGGKTSIEILSDSTRSDDPTSYEQDYQSLVKLLSAAQSKNILVVGIVFPLAPQYRNTGSYGKYGMRRSAAFQILQDVEALRQKYPNFHYLDENRMGDHDYPDEMAYDYDHLNVTGAAKLTARLDSLLQTLK